MYRAVARLRNGRLGTNTVRPSYLYALESPPRMLCIAIRCELQQQLAYTWRLVGCRGGATLKLSWNDQASASLSRRCCSPTRSYIVFVLVGAPDQRIGSKWWPIGGVSQICVLAATAGRDAIRQSQALREGEYSASQAEPFEGMACSPSLHKTKICQLLFGFLYSSSFASFSPSPSIFSFPSTNSCQRGI